MTPRTVPPTLRRAARRLALVCALGALTAAARGETALEAAAEWSADAVLKSSAPGIVWKLDCPFSLGTGGSLTVAAEGSDAASAAALPSEAQVSRQVAAAGSGSLQASWAAVAAAVDALGSLPDPSAIRTIETALETLESALDAFLADVEAAEVDRADAEALAAQASELARHADRLESTASRIRLYAKGSAAATLTRVLQGVVRAFAGAERDEYLAGLRRLASAAEDARGGELRSDAADSVRSGCDALVRRLSVRTAKRSLDIGWSAEILGLDLDAELAAARTAAAAPSGGDWSLSAEASLACEAGDAELALSFRSDDVRVDDRLREDSTKTTSEIEASAAWQLGEIELDARIARETEDCPLLIDAEIGRADVVRAQDVVAALDREVTEAILPSATKRTLLNDLTLARTALGEDRRGDAEDAIEGFVDHVESERWKGNVPAAAAAAWTQEAQAIESRRKIQRLDLPINLEAPFGDGTVDVELDWSKITYLTNAALCTAKSSAAAAWSTQRGEWTIDAHAKQTRTRYPAAPAKDVATSELAVETRRPVPLGEVELAAEVSNRTRPAAPEEDRSDASISGSWCGTWGAISWTLDASEKARRYPNNSSRLGTTTRADALDVEIPLAGGVLAVAWKTETVRTFAGDPDEDTSTLAVAWDFETGDVEVSLSVSRKLHTDWTSPGNDRKGLEVAATVTIPF